MSARRLSLLAAVAVLAAVGWSDLAAGTRPAPAGEDGAVRKLAEEMRAKGWIAFAARSDKGDWDLFIMRPDGSDLRNLTRTSDYNEALVRFSPDGRRMLYRRTARNESFHDNHHGTQGELVFARGDGADPNVYGKAGEYPWASWSPDGAQIATLTIRGIAFIDIATRKVVRTLPRQGFFQQLTWSPDGKWLSGVSNGFGTSWTVARMDARTGAANAVSRVQCCTPDWFPDSKRLVFSNRPLGQKGNGGYGWTQLWMAGADGNSPRLVYGEDGRHVYGGHISPDGKYVLFTGNMNEDGDPGNRGAPMGLMRLADAPIIGGASEELRKLHPKVNAGPILTLPAGWEPFWTFSHGPGGATDIQKSTSASHTALAPAGGDGPREPDDVATLAREVKMKGRIIFSAPSGQGDWDLFIARPDGSARRQITDTRQYTEAGARFSPDGTRILYYRLGSGEALDNNSYGTHELVIARADGTDPVSYGREFPWASWGPDGSQIACLDKSGIRIVDPATRKTVRQLPRKGIVEQLVWSPDGKWFVGTANGLGPYWSIARLNATGGQITALSETDRYNCTPDWMGDSRRVVYARGIIPDRGGRAELWLTDGEARHVVYADEARHIYGACASPDGRYVLFTRSEADLGKVDSARTTMSLVRLADAPIAVGTGDALHKRFPAAKGGPRLDLGEGWEPHWTDKAILPAGDAGR